MNLDFVLLTETWLDQASATTTLIEKAPQNFLFMSAARAHRKGGGIAGFVRSTEKYGISRSG